MIKKLTFLLAVVWSLSAAAEGPRTLYVYHIGNSLTRSITMDRLHLLFAEQGIAAGVNVFYADGIHPNPIPHLTGNIANYVNGLTICTAICGKSPKGLTGSIYGLDDAKDAALIKALQDIVWKVVSSELERREMR